MPVAEKNIIASFFAWIRHFFTGMAKTGKHLRHPAKKSAPPSISDPDYFKKVAAGAVTVEYPQVKVPVPDNGRYRLHNEEDDCIACDKCARICPVDCITIESFRAAEDLGRTSDGTVKRLHLPVFDIDMAKCCYCGLCTTVCPTECLTMTKVYDFSEFDRDNFVYHFGNQELSPEVTEKKKAESEELLKKKKAEAAATKTPAKKPLFKTKPKPAEEEKAEQPQTEKKKIIPKRKPVIRKEDAEKTDAEGGEKKFRPKPMIKKPIEKQDASDEIKDEKQDAGGEDQKPKPKFRPKPLIKKKKNKPEEDQKDDTD